MQRVSRGYTIVEIMIVLAISLSLLLMATKFLAGSQGHTEFSQSMRDLQSTVQSWLDSVPNGFAFGSQATSSCQAPGASSPKIDTPSSGTTPDCIYLGKAIQFTDKPSTTVYAYSVFGRRLDSSTGDLVATIKAASPVPAAGTAGTGSANFTETYTLKDGTVLSGVRKSSGVLAENSHLGGFYLSLNTDAAIGQNGDTQVNSYQYPAGNYPNVNDVAIIKCIENSVGFCQLGASATAPAPLTSWQLCFENNANKETALLTIGSSNGQGAFTQLDFKAC